MDQFKSIISHFAISGTVSEIKPLGNGLINDTYKVTTVEADAPDYVLQRINDSIFTDVDLLQNNIEEVTHHIREQLVKEGADDIDRKVLTFVKTDEGKTYIKDGKNQYWRISVFIPNAITMDAVTTPARLSESLRPRWQTSPTASARPSQTSTTWNCAVTNCVKL